MYFAVMVLLCVADALAGYRFVTGGAAVRVASVVSHLVIVGLFGMTLVLRRRVDPALDQNFLIVAVGAGLFLPVYGLAGLTLLSPFLRKNVVEDYSHLQVGLDELPGPLQELLNTFDGDIMHVVHDETAIESFLDLFSGEDSKLEENVINKLGKIGNRNAVQILQSVLNHSTSDSRILAASALIEIEEKTVKNIEILENRLKTDKSATSQLLELARAYDLYCHLGVLDGSVIDYYRGFSMKYYENYIVRESEDTRARVEYGRMVLRAGEYDVAITHFERAIEQQPEEMNTYIWLAEAFYEKGDFRALRALCAWMADSVALPAVVQEVISWWAVDAFVEQTTTERLEAVRSQNIRATRLTNKLVEA